MEREMWAEAPKKKIEPFANNCGYKYVLHIDGNVAVRGRPTSRAFAGSRRSASMTAARCALSPMPMPMACPCPPWPCALCAVRCALCAVRCALCAVR
eukprot:3061228-Prymnesium_polylepis.1